MKLEIEFFDVEKETPKENGEYLGMADGAVFPVVYWKECTLGTHNPWRDFCEQDFPAYPDFWAHLLIKDSKLG
jgi:hypothetical protein